MRGVSNNNQNPQGEVYYDAFGLPSLRQGQMPGPLVFAGASGYQTDTDTGLMLLGNRYYDRSIGRFLSLDKVHDGNNWYAYCGNDPLTRTDPTGNVFQVSPTTLTSQGQLHGMLEGMRGGIEDEAWNHSFDVLPQKHNQMTITLEITQWTLNSQTGAVISQKSLGEEQYTMAVPPNVSLITNLGSAANHFGDAPWFYSKVHTGGDWDYKTKFHDNAYADFGNFNYGVVGTNIGFSSDFLLNMAGDAAHRNGSDKGHPEWGSWGVGFRGDQPQDQTMIKAGVQYYNKNFPW